MTLCLVVSRWVRCKADWIRDYFVPLCHFFFPPIRRDGSHLAEAGETKRLRSLKISRASRSVHDNRTKDGRKDVFALDATDKVGIPAWLCHTAHFVRCRISSGTGILTADKDSIVCAPVCVCVAVAPTCAFRCSCFPIRTMKRSPKLLGTFTTKN